MDKIQMVDLKGQYLNMKDEMDTAMSEVVNGANFINGHQVSTLSRSLEDYLKVKHVIPCANGTDALQIAMMALDLKPGDEVITPSFTYFATVEVVALLKLKVVFCEVNPTTFTMDIDHLQSLINEKTKVIVPVHLYGQSADMEPILKIAAQHNLFVIEDNAQGIGGYYTFSDGTQKSNGSMGHIGTTSFFPSKNLGCYGDGGALYTQDDALAVKIKMIANHGQREKYVHEIVGCNSRLDTLQAAVLNVKLPKLDMYCNARRAVAAYYDAAFSNHPKIQTPFKASYAHHVYHQYTIILKDVDRDLLKNKLAEKGIPSMIYYPIPSHKQKVFSQPDDLSNQLATTEQLTKNVLSLPIHTEMTKDQLDFISSTFLTLINEL